MLQAQLRHMLKSQAGHAYDATAEDVHAFGGQSHPDGVLRQVGGRGLEKAGLHQGVAGLFVDGTQL